MKKTIKTKDLHAAYVVLSSAKFGKMDDADKIKLWKIGRTLKPIAMKFEEDKNSAIEKLKPEGFDERAQAANEFQQAQQSNNIDASKLKMGPEEFNAFVLEANNYNKLVDDAVKEYAEAEVEIDIEPLTEDAFGKLMASNELTLGKAVMLADIVAG